MSESSDIEIDQLLREKYDTLDPEVKRMLEKNGDGIQTLKIILDASLEIREVVKNLCLIIPLICPDRRIGMTAMMTFIKMNLRDNGEMEKVQGSSDLMISLMEQVKKMTSN